MTNTQYHAAHTGASSTPSMGLMMGPTIKPRARRASAWSVTWYDTADRAVDEDKPEHNQQEEVGAQPHQPLAKTSNSSHECKCTKDIDMDILQLAIQMTAETHPEPSTQM